MIKRKAINKTQTTEIYGISGTLTFWKKKIIPGKDTTTKTSFKDYKVEIPLVPAAEKEAKDSIVKRAITKFFKWLLIFLISNFLGGYIGHISEPVYKSIDTIFFNKKQSMPSAVKCEIQSDAKIILWNNNITQNYIDNALALWGQRLVFKTSVTNNVYYQCNRLIHKLQFLENHQKALPP